MKTARPLILTALCISFIVFTVTMTERPVSACVMPPQEIIENIDEYLAACDGQYNANPNDPNAIYNCARAHLLAAVRRTQSVTVHTYNTLQDYSAPVAVGAYISEAQATEHCRRALELLARLEAVQPDNHAVYMARGFLLEHCSRDLDLTPADLSPMSAEETARWQAAVGDLNHPQAATRERAYRQLAAAGDAVLPVLATAAGQPATLAIRTQVRTLIQACYRERALTNYRRAYELYTAAAKDQDETAFYTERLAAGNACLRLIRMHTISGEEQRFVRGFEKLQKRMNKKYGLQPQVEPCLVDEPC